MNQPNPAPQPPKLLDQYRNALRIKHYSPRTEDTYLQWVKNFILFHGKRHPKEMGVPEIAQYLTHLATKQEVAASTQNPCTELVEVRLSAPSSSSTATS